MVFPITEVVSHNEYFDYKAKYNGESDEITPARIPDELREAARVDGASEFNIFRYIILPLLRPVTLSAMVILGHMSLKTFDLVIATVGKQLVLDMPSVNMWQSTFDGLQYGSGAAISMLLLISTAVLIIPYLFFSLRKEVKQ